MTDSNVPLDLNVLLIPGNVFRFKGGFSMDVIKGDAVVQFHADEGARAKIASEILGALVEAFERAGQLYAAAAVRDYALHNDIHLKEGRQT